MHRRTHALLACGAALLAGCAAEASRPSLLLFVVDTLRADRVGAFAADGGAARALTPRVDALAAGARVYEAAYSQATQTHPAMASMLTGLAPPHHGVVAQSLRHREGVVTLAELLQEDGYRTGSFVANLCHLQDFGRTVWSDGWDVQFCGEDLGVDQYLWDQAVVDAGLEWIEEDGSPFFAWLHLMDPHGEYRPAPDLWDYAAHPVRERFEQSTFYGGFLERYEVPPADVLDELNALYDAQVVGVDRQFGRVIDALQASGRGSNTYVVFTSDHGEELFETWPKVGHGFSLTEGVLRVPLLLAGPGVEPGRVAETVETLQVTPTVLQLLGIEAPYPLDGGSLLDESPGRGWAASYVGDRASVRRAERRWWGRSGLLEEVRPVREYLDRYSSHRRSPWYEANELLADYAPGSNVPEWRDLSDPSLDRAASVVFRQPLRAFLREGGLASGDQIRSEELDRALERMGYK